MGGVDVKSKHDVSHPWRSRDQVQDFEPLRERWTAGAAQRETGLRAIRFAPTVGVDPRVYPLFGVLQRENVGHGPTYHVAVEMI
jgi:hypothetical protein